MIRHRRAEATEALVGAQPGVQTVIDLVHDMARRSTGTGGIGKGGAGTGGLGEPGARWTELFRQCLVRAQRRGDVKADLDPGRVARLVVGSWTGLRRSSHVLSGRADLTEETTRMWEMLLPSIVPPRRLERFRPEGSALETV